MNLQQEIYQKIKAAVLAAPAGVDVDRAYGNQCVDVFLLATQFYFPDKDYRTTVPVMHSARLAAEKRNDEFYEWIPNNHADPNQLPVQGDILIADQTPQAGYTCTAKNPDGHLGIVESADSHGYTLLMQDGSIDANHDGKGDGKAFLQTKPWKFRPVIGWLRPRLQNANHPIAVEAVAHPVAKPPTLSRSNIGKRFYPTLVANYPAYKPGTRNVRARLDAKNVPSARSYLIRDIDSLPNTVLVTSGQFGTLALSTDDGGTIK